ncbi:MAG: hypothetical protein ACLFQ5_06695 [Oceanicaulis sp.]
MRAVCAVIFIGVLSLGACSDTRRSEPEPLELPHWRECMESYGGDIDARFEAYDRGEEFAILCALSIDEGRDLPRADLENLYRLYRLRGREPEGLDALVRRYDRATVASLIRSRHRFSGELDPFENTRSGCPKYDPVARELILRAEPGGDMFCVPRRWVFWG